MTELMHARIMVDCMEAPTVMGAGVGGDRGGRIPMHRTGGETQRGER